MTGEWLTVYGPTDTNVSDLLKACPWWKEEESYCPGIYILNLIGLVVVIHSLGVSHTNENIIIIYLFFANIAVGIDL